MLNDSQQRKALVLSLLMVMLAQTAYIESYRGWTLADQPNPSLLNAGCNDTPELPAHRFTLMSPRARTIGLARGLVRKPPCQMP